MRLSHWLVGLARKQLHVRRSTRRNQHGDLWPAAELLEDRTLLSTFTVDSTSDTIDVNPGDGVAEDAGGLTTLRAAIMEANALDGDDRIYLSAETYSLSISGTGEQAAASGDLDITDSDDGLTIIGAGSTATGMLPKS
jgi:hypothetical protein